MAEAGDRALAAATQLEKIGFVEFSTHLVRDVYRVIVEASMDQLKAYADFVEQIAKNLEEYQAEVVGEGDEQTSRADSYIEEVLSLNIPDNANEETELSITDEQAVALQQHFLGVNIEAGEPSTSVNIDGVITGDSGAKKIKLVDLRSFVIEKLKKSAKESYDLIKTILKIGMQKVVVTNGEIHTKLTFHVDASDTSDKNATKYEQKSKSWGVRGSISGRAGDAVGGSIAGVMFGNFIGGSISGGYNSSKLNVSVVNEKSASATNVNIDILGEVKILFRTETFPSIEE